MLETNASWGDIWVEIKKINANKKSSGSRSFQMIQWCVIYQISLQLMTNLGMFVHLLNIPLYTYRKKNRQSWCNWTADCIPGTLECAHIHCVLHWAKKLTVNWLTSVSLIQLSSPLSRPPTPLSDTLDGTPSWSLPMESTLKQELAKIHFFQFHTEKELK